MTSDLDQATRETLSTVATATLTTVLLKKGLRNVWMRGAMPIRTGQKRVVGPAFTLRFVPAREDLATPASWASPISTRAAIEAMPPGCVAVVDAMGITDAGIFGDILCERMRVRQVAALVTDGVIRDLAGVLRANLPTWSAGVAAPPSVASLTFVAWQQPVGCGGVAIFPDDIIVADEDGAVVIPAGILDEVASEAAEQEQYVSHQRRKQSPLPRLPQPPHQGGRLAGYWLVLTNIVNPFPIQFAQNPPNKALTVTSILQFIEKKKKAT
jgi:regulator of RNase E activity RraA